MIWWVKTTITHNWIHVKESKWILVWLFFQEVAIMKQLMRANQLLCYRWARNNSNWWIVEINRTAKKLNLKLKLIILIKGVVRKTCRDFHNQGKDADLMVKLISLNNNTKLILFRIIKRNRNHCKPVSILPRVILLCRY